MAKIKAIETNEAENDETEVDPIEVIYQGECPSISGRSTLTYAIGRHSEDGKLHLAITGNSGKGIFAADWAPASAIQEVVLGAFGLTGASFHGLHEGRSRNTGAFILAAIKALGLVRANAENTRLHEHIPTTTFEQLVMAHIGESQEPAPKHGRRKVKGG